MAAVTSIPIDRLKTFADWRTAPLGALLQVFAASGDAVVGMRCEMQVSGPHPCLLLLDGNERGLLLEAGAVRDAALDVSSLLEIRIKELTATAMSGALHEVYGILCESGGGSGHLFMKAKTRGSIRGYVRVADPTGKIPNGTVMLNQSPPHLLVLGITETTERPQAQSNGS